MSRKLLLVINPRAGQKKAARVLAEIVRLFSDYDCECTVYVTCAPGDGMMYVKSNAARFDLVVCSGGDGTLNETVNGVLGGGAGCPIGYIPSGTTNDLASSLGLSRDLMTAARDIMEGSVRELDIGRMNDRYFLYTACFGAFTRSSYSTSQDVKNALGYTAYLLEGLRDLTMIRPVPMRVIADGAVYEGNYLFGSISNSTSIGGLMKLKDSLVQMDDGRFEVLLIENPANAAQLANAVLSITNQTFDAEGVQFLNASHVEIVSPQMDDWTLDGEYMPGSERGVIENLHRTLHIFVPKMNRIDPAEFEELEVR